MTNRIIMVSHVYPPIPEFSVTISDDLVADWEARLRYLYADKEKLDTRFNLLCRKIEAAKLFLSEPAQFREMDKQS